MSNTASGQSIQGKYDSDLIAAIVKDKQQENSGPPKADPFTEINEWKCDQPRGTVLFSQAFWKPKTIPDLPLPVFKVKDWDEEAQFHIPEVDVNWIWNKPVTEAFALALYCNDTTLLHGLQGTGKSCLPLQWCAKFNIPAWRMSCNRETREAHFLGSPSVEYNDEGQMFIRQEPTILTDSLKYGGMFIEDEAFRHNAALVLQALREKNTRSILLPDAPGRTSEERKLVAPEGRWWYILTDNTCGSGDETGIFDAEVQDASTLDRIGASIEVQYLGKPQERRILQKHCGLNVEIINGMLDFAKLVRKAFEGQALLATFSVRALLAWAEKTEMTGSIQTALKLTWYDKLCADDKATVKDMFHQVFAREL